MAQTKWKRRRLIVDKEFQFRYLMTWVLLTMSLLAGLLLASLAVFYFFANTGMMLAYFVVVIGACAMVITGVSMYYIVVHSHRIAGPAYRLQRLIKEVAAGRRGFRVRLRKKDYLKHIADAVNELIEKLEERESRVNELAGALGELSNDGHDVNVVHDVAGRVSRELKDLCPMVQKVKVDGEE
jgi:methyl-accepting chemotaxis protein